MNDDDNFSKWRPEEIVLGPGGVKGFLLLGALLKITEVYPDKIKYWTGCSIGSAIALMMTCSYSIKDMIEDCLNFDILEDFNDFDISMAIEKDGLISNQTMEKILTSRVKDKFGYIPTLKQLYIATDIVYTSITYNYDKMQKEYLNKDTNPNLSCIEAAMMSMSMPIIIQPRIYKGCEYLDGAIGDPYPVLYHDNDSRNILGIYISSESHNIRYKNSKISILYKAYGIIEGFIKTIRDEHIELSSDKVKHLELNSSVIDSIGVTLSREDKQGMIDKGFRMANLFLDKEFNPDKYTILLPDDEEIPIISDLSDNSGNSFAEDS